MTVKADGDDMFMKGQDRAAQAALESRSKTLAAQAETISESAVAQADRIVHLVAQQTGPNN